jgi:ADP-ribose pyrophosphatase YjhB (NUDIX family)
LGPAKEGHIAPDEKPTTAAAREVREETGIAVEILCPIGTVDFTARGEKVRVAYFLARAERTAEVCSPEGRRLTWMPKQCAVMTLTHAEARAMLAAAANTLNDDGASGIGVCGDGTT